MREKLETLSLVQLKALAKAEGFKGISAMKKADLVELLLKHAQAKSEKTESVVKEEKAEPAAKEEKAEPVAKEGKAGSAAKEEKAEPAAKKTKPEKAKSAAKSEKTEPEQKEKKAVIRGAQNSRNGQNNRNTQNGGNTQNNRNAQNGASAQSNSRNVQNNGNAQSNGNSQNNRTAQNGRNVQNNRNSRNNVNGQNNRNAQGARNNQQTVQGVRTADTGRAQNVQQSNQAQTDHSFGSQQNIQAQNTQVQGASTQNNQSQNVQTQGAQSQNRQPQNPVQNNQQQIPQPRTKVADTEGVKVSELDSGEMASGILEIMQDGFGFIRSDNFLPGEDDVYVAPSQIRRFDLRTGDVITGSKRVRTAAEKFAALLYVKTINGRPADGMPRRRKFENLTPIFPNKRIHLDTGADTSVAMRIVDIISPIGKGQRGMIVSPPKAGKTTLLKQVAKAVKKNEPDMHIIILLIDERPEEVTDMKEEVEGPGVEVIYSTFDEQPEQQKRVSEMVIERAKRLVEQGQDVMILLDSITRLARAYNLTVTPSGRTLSGGLDPAALYSPKRFFGAARNLREGGSLTILATALIDTGSRLDDMVFEEFKGTGNMELVLDRKLSERRIFPAIDILKSGTRRDDLLLSVQEQDASNIIHKMLGGSKPDETAEVILDLFYKTRTNREFIERLRMYRR